MAVAADYTQVAEQLYLAYFGRPADRAGLLNMTADLAASGAPTDIADFKTAYATNGTVKAIMDNFGNSTESQTLYGTGSDESFIVAIYQHVLNRDPLLAGLDFWTHALQNHEMTRTEAAAQIIAAATKADADPTDLATVTNKVTVATNFTAAIDTAAEVIGYAGKVAGQTARDMLATVTSTTDTVAFNATIDATLATIVSDSIPSITTNLTTGIDTVAPSSGNDIINAPVISGTDTFSSLDNIDGGAGSDTMNLVSQSGSLAGAAGATVKNVETVNLTSAVAITAADVSGFTGLTTLNVAGAAAITGVAAAATTNVNIANGLGNIGVDGGLNVNVTTSGGNITVGASTGAAGTVTATNTNAGGTVTVKGAGALNVTGTDGAVVFNKGTAITATAADAVAQATRTAHLATQTSASAANTAATVGNGGNGTDASGVALTAAQAKVTGLTTLATAITNATNVSADSSTALSIELATKTAYQAGYITAADKIAIDAAFAANLPTLLATARTAAQAVLTPLQTAATAASTAAAAADVAHDATVLAAKTAADAAVTADNTASALVNDMTVSAASNTALAAATIKGNYGTATVQVGTGGLFQNAVTDGSSLHNTLTSVTLENTGHSELTGLALTAVSATDMASNVKVVNTTANHTETFTLSGVTGGTYTDAAATTVKVVSNGSATNVLTGLSAASATAVTVTGAAGLTFGTTTFDAAAVIDASGSSGANTITVAAGQTYKGGSGVDTVTTNNGALQTKTVDGGAGTADTLNLANAADYATTGAAKFLNFEVLSLASGLTADVTAFTGSTITSEVLNGGAAVLTGLNATQAGHITVTANGTYTVGVTGASTVGQLDTIGMTVSDGSSTVNTITLTTPVLTGVETLNITATDNVVISALTSSTALTNVNVTGAGTVSITSGAVALNVNTVINASADNSNTVLDFGAGLGNGVSLRAGDGTNTLTGTDIAGKGNTIVAGNGVNTVTGGQADDVITLGNGNNVVHGAAGANTITVGNGDNTIDVGAGGSTITAGNGWNVITGGSGADTITVGTGGNLIAGGAGADIITFGTHVAGVIDGVKMLVAGDTLSAANVAAMATAAATTLAGVDIVTGMHAGDTISLFAAANTVAGALGTTIASAAAAVAGLVQGTYDTTAHTFTASATGTDSLVVYDADGTGAGVAVEAIVLVGYHGTATATAGIITLA